MRSAKLLINILSGLAVVIIYGYALAGEQSVDVSKTLAVISVKSGNVDKGVYRQFDRLVPELKNIAKNKVFKLECRYAGQPDLEKDVERAYNLAASIERYLRVRHKLDLDMWIAIDIKPKYAKSSPVLTLAILPDKIKKLDSVLLAPINN